MRDISNTGNGLEIVLSCEYLPHHDWMSFVSWYSVSKNLPDAKFSIRCLRNNTETQLFNWPKRCNVVFSQYKGLKKQLIESTLEIEPHIMAIREYANNNVISVKEELVSTFVSYFEGCGKFVLNEWIDKGGIPLANAVKKFSMEIMTTNELRILKLWEKSFNIYREVK